MDSLSQSPKNQNRRLKKKNRGIVSDSEENSLS